MTGRTDSGERGIAHGRRGLSRRAFLRASAAVAFAAACAPGAPGGVAGTAAPGTAAATAAPAARRGGSLTILSGAGVSTLDPYFTTAGSAELSQQIFDALIDFRDDPDKPTGQLAESWDETDTTLTLKLRRGVKFHNGRDFTSQDVVDTIARAKDKAVGHQMFAIIDPTVASAEAVDSHTVRINYKKLNPSKFEDLAQLYVIPKENWANVTKEPIGTGPFKFVKHVAGSEVQLERFDQYWQKDRPFLDKITVKIITDPQARVANMTAGSGDVMPAVPRADFDRLSKEPSLEAKKIVTTVWDDIILNTSKRTLSDQRVRQALNYSIDREKINKLAYFGQLELSQREFPKGHWALNEKANQRYTFDLEKAKGLLAQAGLAQGFETSINVGLRPEWKQYAQIWAQDLVKIGVKLQIKELETAVFYQEYNNMEWDIQAFASGIGKQDPSSLVAS